MKASMVFTIAKSRHFHNSIVRISCSLVFLCEYGMGNIDILGLAPPVSNDKALLIDAGQKILEVLEKGLYRRRIEIGPIDWRADWLIQTRATKRLRTRASKSSKSSRKPIALRREALPPARTSRRKSAPLISVNIRSSIGRLERNSGEK